MASHARIKKTFDFNRFREAIQGSNVRAWVELARVDDVDDAISWIEGTGWVVDVSFITGQLAEEAAVPCRVASHLGGNDQGVFTPIRRGCVVVVIIGAGNINVAPVIIGYLHNPTDCQVPTEVNELPIDEDAALANVIVKSIANYEAEYGDTVRIQAKEQMALVAPRVDIAPDDVRGPSGEPFVRGDDLGDALSNLAGALSDFLEALALSAPTSTGGVNLGTFNTQGGFLLTAIEQFQATIAPAPAGWKSTKIFGE